MIFVYNVSNSKQQQLVNVNCYDHKSIQNKLMQMNSNELKEKINRLVGNHVETLIINNILKVQYSYCCDHCNDEIDLFVDVIDYQFIGEVSTLIDQLNIDFSIDQNQLKEYAYENSKLLQHLLQQCEQVSSLINSEIEKIQIESEQKINEFKKTILS